MIQKYKSKHHADKDGNLAGGYFKAAGVAIRWQKGPLGRGAKRKQPNGAFVETALVASKERLEYYQKNQKYACVENAEAIKYLDLALKALEERTKRREAAGIEGTHAEETQTEAAAAA